MFHVPIGSLMSPRIMNYDSYSLSIESSHQLSFHFLKKDEITGETREVGINDDLKIVKFVKNDGSNKYPIGDSWSYVNLKDVLFFTNSYSPTRSAAIFSRDKNKFYSYFKRYTPANDSIFSFFPNIVHITHKGKDYLVHSKRLNTNDLTLDPIWALSDSYTQTLIDKINELLKKYSVKDDYKYTACAYTKIDENTWIISGSSYITRYSILADGKTPFPDCFLATVDTNDAELAKLQEKYRDLEFKSGDSLFIPKVHTDYFPYDKTRKVGTDISGKFDLYDADYLRELPQQPIILEPMHNIGLLVNAFHYNDDTDLTLSDFVISSNVLFTRSPHVFDGFNEFDLTFYCGKRSVKRRYSKRNRLIGTYDFTENMPKTITIECTPYNLMNVCGYTIYENKTYPLILMKDADIYRTPKNKDYDYYGSITEVPIDLYRDSGTSSSNYNKLNWGNAPRNTAVLQKGFTGKTALSNSDDYKSSPKTVGYYYGKDLVESNDMTLSGFRDFEMDYALRQWGILYNDFPTKTRAPYKFQDWEQIGYKEADGLVAASDNILVDAQFDYFNDVFRDAPIYIVDTKILKTLGLSAPRFHRFMPNRCIWFEVDDLYTYDDAGKITGYNTTYVDSTNGSFIYNFKLFTSFKVRLYENVEVVTYDTQKDVMEDFTYATNADTGAILDPILQVCDDISEFHIVMWVPLQKAILRIGNIKLNTEVA